MLWLKPFLVPTFNSLPSHTEWQKLKTYHSYLEIGIITVFQIFYPSPHEP